MRWLQHIKFSYVLMKWFKDEKMFLFYEVYEDWNGDYDGYGYNKFITNGTYISEPENGDMPFIGKDVGDPIDTLSQGCWCIPWCVGKIINRLNHFISKLRNK